MKNVNTSFAIDPTETSIRWIDMASSICESFHHKIGLSYLKMGRFLAKEKDVQKCASNFLNIIEGVVSSSALAGITFEQIKDILSFEGISYEDKYDTLIITFSWISTNGCVNNKISTIIHPDRDLEKLQITW